MATSSPGQPYVPYRDARVLTSTLRSLEAKDLAERVPKSASSVYTGGPLQDRVRLTSAGAIALASALGLPPSTGATPGTTPPPVPTAAQTAARSRSHPESRHPMSPHGTWAEPDSTGSPTRSAR
ncbi:hypothetical protein ACFVWX_04055 [Streptomyces sp. NPDC058220]|uniref:hypothetical protein n=1 Tax=unclassified Streptomyces TaxID=2593676 RepID=UPI0036590FDA